VTPSYVTVSADSSCRSGRLSPHDPDDHAGRLTRFE